MTKVRKKIGTIPINDIEQQAQQSVSSAVEQMQQDVTDFIDEETAQYPEIGGTFKYIEDSEGRLEVETDKDGKIISYRKEDGTLVENAGIDTKSLKINGEDIADYIGNNAKYVGDKTFIYCERPKFGEMWFYGTLPTDTSEARTPTELLVVYKVSGTTVFSSKCKLSIQGHGSVGYPKHNYTIDFLNDNEDELVIKFGDMIGVDSYHLKGYWSDKTHSRGVGSAALWRAMIKTLDHPYSKINNIPLNVDADQSTNQVETYDAKYSEDGFPVAGYLNDEFYGLFTIKLKKTRQNYAMDKAVKGQIFLDSITSNAYLYQPFDHSDWEVKNPKIKNYEEGGEITDSLVLNSCQRLFGFLNDIESQAENYEDYIVLPHWICWLILQEIIGGWDTNGNNYELLTWNAKKNTVEGEDVYSGNWSILPYDMDLTIGLEFTGGGVEPGSHRSFYSEQDGFIASKSERDVTHPDIRVDVFFSTFRKTFESQIKELYTKLRKDGFITESNLIRFYINQCDCIPRDFQEEDKKRWGAAWVDNKETSIEHIYSFIHSRIEFLDSQWFINE